MITDNIITIDGGAASGKSSTSRLLAEHLNLLHVDTGSHYRSLTHALMDAGCDPENLPQVFEGLANIALGTEIEQRQAKILINGNSLSDDQIRSELVNQNVSKFASIPEVRSKLLDYQRSQADGFATAGFEGLVMEGRDIGSVVFPDAKHRFYLFADPATRQARRAKEGQIDSIQERDKLDSGRKTAPLKVPEGATLVDSSDMSLQEVVEHIASLIFQ